MAVEMDEDGVVAGIVDCKVGFCSTEYNLFHYVETRRYTYNKSAKSVMQNYNAWIRQPWIKLRLQIDFWGGILRARLVSFDVLELGLGIGPPGLCK